MRVPIYFEDYRICIRCGSHNVVPIDKFGRESKQFIYPVSFFQCKTCNQTYTIKWIRDKDNNMIPVCSDNTQLTNVEDSIIIQSIHDKRSI